MFGDLVQVEATQNFGTKNLLQRLIIRIDNQLILQNHRRVEDTCSGGKLILDPL